MSEIQYRLVVEDPAGAAFAPGDLTIGDDHFWVTSRPTDGHAWIAEPPDGEGQSIDLVTGKTTDGQYTVKVIDVPEDACSAWTGTEVADAVALGWDNNYLTTGGWTKGGTPTPGTYPEDTIHTWWSSTGGAPLLGGSALFMWVDTFAGPPYSLGPWYRETYVEKTITGLTPGATYGITFSASWSVDTGAGNVFFEIDGASGPNRLALTATGSTIWTITTLEQDVQYRLRATATGAGEVTIRVGGENYAPSCNVTCGFSDLTLVELTCAAYGAAGGDRYVTSWLADAAARQQLMGRRAWVEQTTDAGTSWDMLLPGYVTDLVMDASLTYVFTIGDTRRVERTRSAWRDLDPVNEPYFERVTALIGGPVYGGFVPYSPTFALPRFRVVAYTAPTGDRADTDASDGSMELNYISGPMPPGFRHPGSQHAVNLVHRTVNDRAQSFFDSEATWDAALPSGAFPGLRATLFADADGTVTHENLTPLGQNFERITKRPTSGPGQIGGFPFELERGQEFIDTGLQIVLRPPNSAAAVIVGDYYYVLITPREPSEAFPLYLRGHPVDVEAALLARHGITVDATTKASVKAALGDDLIVVRRCTDASEKVQDVCDELHAFFGYATRVGADGEKEFFQWRAFVASTPTLNATTNDLREEGGPTYALAEDSRKNRVIVEQQYFRTISFDDEDIIGAPDAIAVVSGTQTFDYSSDGGTTVDADTYGAQEATYKLAGHVAWAYDRAAAGDLEASAPMSQQQWGQGVARHVFAQTSRGVQEATIVTLRGCADADAAKIGDEFALDADHVPNAQLGQTPISQRGGSRWWRVTRRDESPQGAILTMADAGTGVAYGEVVTLQLKPDSYDPEYFRELYITNSTALNTDGAWLELEVELSTTAPAGAGVRYTILDGLQMVDGAGLVVDPFLARLGPFPVGANVWVRARGFLLGGSPGTWSAWTSIGGVQGGAGDLSNLVIYPVGTTTATLTWTNTDAVNQVRVEYRLNDTGAWTIFATLGIGSATSTLTGLSMDSMYGVQVYLWDGAAMVGSALTGQLRTGAGDISSLVISSITASGCVLQWGNSHPTGSVKVEYLVTGTPFYTTDAIYPPTSVNARLNGLTPATSYTVRVVLVDARGVEFGSVLVDVFSTLGATATLDPPTNPAIFAGTDPANGGFARGLYGLSVMADTDNPQHSIVIEEAVETAVSSGTPGTYSEISEIPAQYFGPTLWSGTCPNDLKRRWLRAFSRAFGYADSTATTALSIDPWSTTPPVDNPIYGTITIPILGATENSQTTADILIPPGAEIYRFAVNTHDSRLRLYNSDANRTADAPRHPTTLPSFGSGCYCDVVLYSGIGYDWTFDPPVRIVDLSGNYTPELTVYCMVDSYDVGSVDVTWTLYYQVPRSRVNSI